MEQGQSKLASPLVLGIVGVSLVAALLVGYQFMPSTGGAAAPAASAKADPNADFYREMAAKCDGDISKLSPQNQMAVIQKAGGGNYARQILVGYAPKK